MHIYKYIRVHTRRTDIDIYVCINVDIYTHLGGMEVSTWYWRVTRNVCAQRNSFELWDGFREVIK